jgi:uncharacterized membrane protein required for colicin V production
VNELDYLIIFIVLLGAGIGLRRGLIRVLISIVGIYATVLVAGYLYKPVGNTISGAFDRVGIDVGLTGSHNFSYIVAVVAMTVVVELVSRATFEGTRLRSFRALDTPLGGIVGVFYGALWASLFLVPGQYTAARSGGAWLRAVNQSALVPTLNNVFRDAVLDVVGIFFLNGTPELFINAVFEQVSHLFLNLASICFLAM